MGDPFNLGDGRQFGRSRKSRKCRDQPCRVISWAAGSKSVKRKVWNPLCDRNPL